MKTRTPHSRRLARSWNAAPIKRKREAAGAVLVYGEMSATRSIPGPDVTGYKPWPILDATQAQPGPDFTGAYRQSI